MSGQNRENNAKVGNRALNRRKMLLGGTTFAAAALKLRNGIQTAQAQQQSAPSPSGKKQNILVIFGDDIGQSNISAYTFGLTGYKTPNIDRLAREGMMFTDYYAEQSCTAGRSTFITGQCTLRTGLSVNSLTRRPYAPHPVGDTFGAAAITLQRSS
jgi:alkaline phosphatase